MVNLNIIKIIMVINSLKAIPFLYMGMLIIRFVMLCYDIYIFYFSPSGVVGCTVVDGTIVVGAWVVGRDPALHNLVLQQTVEQDSIAPPLLLLNDEQTRSHRDGRIHPLVKNVWFVFESDAC